MKNFRYLLGILCLLLSLQTFGQKNTKVDKITALRLERAIAQKYLDGISIKGFKVDKEGVLRPNKGYEIIYFSKTKQLMVKPIKMNAPEALGVDVAEVPGGILVCHCGFGAGDNCKYNTITDENTVYYFCDGSCGCGDIFIPDYQTTPQYETPDGNWHDLPDSWRN